MCAAGRRFTRETMPKSLIICGIENLPYLGLQVSRSIAWRRVTGGRQNNALRHWVGMSQFAALQAWIDFVPLNRDISIYGY